MLVILTNRKIRIFLNLVILFLLTGCISEGGGVTTRTLFVANTTVTSPTTPTKSPSITETLKPIDIETFDSQLDLSIMNVQEWASTSRDGKWIAVGLVAFPRENMGGQFAYVRLALFRADGKTHWTVIDQWQEVGVGFPMPEPLRWSLDRAHFYFTHRVNPGGCSVFPLLTDLQEVNLTDGTVTELLTQSATTLALAPNESLLAYVGYGERDLVVKNLITQEERKSKINPGKEFNAGNILWSPDGSALILTLAINPCKGEYGLSKTVWAESTTILWVNAETLQQKVLVSEDPRLFITLEWNNPEKITLVDGEENSLWFLDVNTGEITRE
jgi:hypothetical protein